MIASTASLTSLQTSTATHTHSCGRTLQSRSAWRSSRRPVQVFAQGRRQQGKDSGSKQEARCNAAMKLLSALAAAQFAFSGPALADLSQPILPGADITNKDLPDGPKPGKALQGLGGNGIADKATSALGQVSDKAGEKTPDVNVPGFGPFKFNPKEDAKQALKKSPLGFMQANKLVVAGLPSLPGSNVKKSDLPDGPKFGSSPLPQAPSDIGKTASQLSDKAGEATPDVNVPGFGPFKGNPKEDAKQAQNKASELGDKVKSATSDIGDAKDDIQQTVNKRGLE